MQPTQLAPSLLIRICGLASHARPTPGTCCRYRAEASADVGLTHLRRRATKFGQLFRRVALCWGWDNCRLYTFLQIKI